MKPLKFMLLLVAATVLAATTAKAQMTKVWEKLGAAVPRFSYDGTKIIHKGDNSISIWDAKTGDFITGKNLISGAAVSHDSKFLVAMRPAIPDKYDEYYTYTGIYELSEELKLIDTIDTPKFIAFGFQEGAVVKFSRDDKLLYFLVSVPDSTDGGYPKPAKRLIIWDIAKKEVLHTKTYGYINCNSLEISSDGKYYVVGPIQDPPNYDVHTRHFLVYDAVTNEELYKIKAVDGPHGDLDAFLMKKLSRDNKLYTMSLGYDRFKIYDLNDKANLISDCKIPTNYDWYGFCFINKNCFFSCYEGDYKNMVTAEYDPLACKEISRFIMDYTYFVDSYNNEYYLGVFDKEENLGQYYTGLFKYTGDIEENAADNLLYPNPSSGVITISLEDIPNNELKLIIHDTSGKEVYASSIKGEKEIVLDVSSYAKGSYVVMLQGANFSRTYKFVKE